MQNPRPETTNIESIYIKNDNLIVKNEEGRQA